VARNSAYASGRNALPVTVTDAVDTRWIFDLRRIGGPRVAGRSSRPAPSDGEPAVPDPTDAAQVGGDLSGHRCIRICWRCCVGLSPVLPSGRSAGHPRIPRRIAATADATAPARRRKIQRMNGPPHSVTGQGRDARPGMHERGLNASSTRCPASSSVTGLPAQRLPFSRNRTNPLGRLVGKWRLSPSCRSRISPCSAARPRDSPTRRRPSPARATGLLRVFCVVSASRVFTHELADFQGGVFIQEGTLDQISEWFAPQAEIYIWNCRPWIPALDVLQHDHGVTATSDSPSRTRANPPWLRCWRRRGHGTIAGRPRRRAPCRARRGGRRGRR
jgi:hypothetical protein